VLLQAGEWRSAAFLSYIDQTELERDVRPPTGGIVALTRARSRQAVLEAHLDESSEDEFERVEVLPPPSQ
jgi:hypothetical protein